MVAGHRVSKVAWLRRQESGQWLGAGTSLLVASLRFFTCQVDFKCKRSKTKAKAQALTKFLLACHTSMSHRASPSHHGRERYWGVRTGRDGLLRVTKAAPHRDSTAARRRKNICQYYNKSPVHAFFFLFLVSHFKIQWPSILMVS